MEQVNHFLNDVRASFNRYCARYDAHSDVEKRTWDHHAGTIATDVYRGDIFEKASCIVCDLQVDTPPVLAAQTGYAEPSMRCLVLEIGIHPHNPHVPKGYIELRAHSAGSVVLAGGTDIFPYMDNPGMVEAFADRMRRTCALHGQDYEQLRRVRADFFRSKLRGTRVGSHAGIYSFALAGDAMAFCAAMAETFFSAYGDIVDGCRRIPFTPEDTRQQQVLHGLWE
jgi:coproporphyrinogen III oxidase